MPISALPHHMRKNGSMAVGDKTDWDNWLQAYVPKGWFAWGPNADEGKDWLLIFIVPVKFGRCEKFPFFRPTGWMRIPMLPFKINNRWPRFPKILIGYGVTRWMGERDREVLFVNSLFEKWTGSLAFWGRNSKFAVTDMKTGPQCPDFKETLDEYGPSPIQYWSKKGFYISTRGHFTFWYQWGKQEPDHERCVYKRKIFIRFGARYDSLDDYHTCPSAFIGGSFN